MLMFKDGIFVPHSTPCERYYDVAPEDQIKKGADQIVGKNKFGEDRFFFNVKNLEKEIVRTVLPSGEEFIYRLWRA